VIPHRHLDKDGFFDDANDPEAVRAFLREYLDTYG